MRNRFSLLFLIFGVLSLPAHATGSLDCEAGDQNIDFVFSTAFGYGMGGPFLTPQAELRIKVPDIPADFMENTFTAEHLVHHWLGEKDIKLSFYHDNPDEPLVRSISLIVEASAKEPEYLEAKGTYHLKIFGAYPDPSGAKNFRLEREGRVICSID